DQSREILKMIEFDANAVVHINENLSAEEIHNIEKELSGVRGVVSACAHVKTPHLMVVDYDPQSIHSCDLLFYIERNGVHASLVGGI
ncbi:MAG: hypothetical protein JAY91_09280, partial [Candidatus Thiodiazotropha endolucinida]|nr:hypothetical protein [Candidatus Thiodiazotropha taylori]MCW4241070.1 hypothetical protein [Candidatus Thiodiazotropha taylori]